MSSVLKTYFNTSALAFWTVHLTPLLILYTGATTFDWILCGIFYFTRIFFVTGVYHRYFGHSTYKLNRFWQFVFAFCAQTTAQKGVLWWASHHVDHHKYSDTEKDPHSMKLFGFMYSHLGWILSREYKDTIYDNVKKYAKYPELRWLNKYYLVPPVLVGAAVFFIWGASALVVGFLLSTVLVWHGTFTINSISHWKGSQRYYTGDESKNNFLLALVTMGEGWHNNHHYYQASCRQGFFWWEIDLTYYILKALSFVGIVKEIRNVPENKKTLESKLMKNRIAKEAAAEAAA